MSVVLRYGAEQSVALRASEEGLLTVCGQPRGAAIDDIAHAVREALAAPLEYPPLARATTPGDRVVLALEPGLPQAGAIVAAAISCLTESGVELDGIAVLCTAADAPPSPEERAPFARDWPAAWQTQVQILVHDPSDARQMAHLARDAAGEPIVLHRALADADLVLPIGLLCSPRAAGYFGVHSGLFPTFSHRRAREPFCTLEAAGASGKLHSRLLKEVAHVAWLLGVNFTLQALPGGGDRVLRVLAGEPTAVGAAGRAAYRTAWRETLESSAQFVVAGIAGQPAEQTWLNLGRALAAALPLVDSGGAIALACELEAAPGPALRALFDAAAPQEVLQRIAKRRYDDMLPALELARALESNRVYLLSRLEPALVEQLGMIPLAGPEELARLVRRQAGGIVLHNAQYADVRFAEEE